MTKKTWQKPKLIILVRGRPEEMVLSACKTSTSSGAAGSKNVGCTRAPCRNCNAMVPS